MPKPLITYALRVLSRFFPPQKPLVFSGANSGQKLADFLMASGQKRPLIVTDGFLSSSGMLDYLLAHFDELGCEASVFHDITPNPTMDAVEAGLLQAHQHRADSIFAIGGGSVIDTAKVIAAAMTDGRPAAKLNGLLKVKVAPLPFYVMPTTSGTGSEVTSAAVISDPQTHAKQFFVDPQYIPIATAFDTNLLKGLPPHITAATGMDALTHAIEAYTSLNNWDDTDRDAATAIKLLFQYLPIAFADGNDVQAREMVALASFLAGYAFTKSSLGYVHAISHQISAHYNTPHGLANAVILPRVMRFNREACAGRFAQLEMMLQGVSAPQSSIADYAEAFIARVDHLASQVEIPLNLKDIQASDYDAITKAALKEAKSSYAVPKLMKKRHVTAILDAVSSGGREPVFT